MVYATLKEAYGITSFNSNFAEKRMRQLEGFEGGEMNGNGGFPIYSIQNAGAPEYSFAPHSRSTPEFESDIIPYQGHAGLYGNQNLFVNNYDQYGRAPESHQRNYGRNYAEMQRNSQIECHEFIEHLKICTGCKSRVVKSLNTRKEGFGSGWLTRNNLSDLGAYSLLGIFLIYIFSKF